MFYSTVYPALKAIFQQYERTRKRKINKKIKLPG
jgi:hypothetical protein